MTKMVGVHVALSAALLVTPATAVLKIKTKSNIKNDRVPAAPPPGATGCVTASAEFTWTVDDQAPLEQARTSTGPDKLALDPAVCAGAQDAMTQINASSTELARLQAAVYSCDEAGLRDLMIENGLSAKLVAGAQFHAINTKGTGCNSGRVSAGSAIPGIAISVGYDAKTKRGYSLANWMYFHAK